MPGIKVRENESFDDAYRKFKKQADRNLVVTESRARRFFEPKTEKRKKQKSAHAKKCSNAYICFVATNQGSKNNKIPLWNLISYNSFL